MPGRAHPSVLVVGAGPAALAAATACARAGVPTTVLAPSVTAPWHQTYGVWVHDVGGVQPAVPWLRVWHDVRVVAGREHRLDLPYGLIDIPAWQRSLLHDAARAGVVVEDGTAVGAHPTGDGVEVLLADRRVRHAGVVLDASGHEPSLVRVVDRRGVAAQVAVGIVARFDTPPATPGVCTLMDWSDVPDTAPHPSFLYALDLGEGWWLVEETSLSARPPAPPEVLEQRLHARLERRGAVPLETARREDVFIPMGRPLPVPGRVVGVGAAGGLVHPVSGYSVAASLRVAARLGPAMADALLVRRTTAADASAIARRVVWPAPALRARALHVFALEAALGFSQRDNRAFFGHFFSLPASRWQTFLTGTAGPSEVAATMRTLFSGAPAGLQWRLAGGDPRHAVRLAADLARAR